MAPKEAGGQLQAAINNWKKEETERFKRCEFATSLKRTSPQA